VELAFAPTRRSTDEREKRGSFLQGRPERGRGGGGEGLGTSRTGKHGGGRSQGRADREGVAEDELNSVFSVSQREGRGRAWRGKTWGPDGGRRRRGASHCSCI